MEDRITPGLYIEMADVPPEIYAKERVSEVLALPRVERATWWECQAPNRKDLKLRMPEFGGLGVYEVEEGFEAPATPEGMRGFHFRHYPRPGQGSYSGKPTLGILLVLISPKHPEGAQALRDWGDFVHIHHIAAVSVPGYTLITPYENISGGEPRFMHFYEMDSEDAEATYRKMMPLVQQRIGGPGNPVYDDWMGHDELVIEYVNTFRRVGERRS